LTAYLASPPISLGRLEGYSNGRVYYHYNLHETGKKELEVVRPVLFLKRMMQHVMPRISRECGIVVSKRQPLSRNIYQ